MSIKSPETQPAKPLPSQDIKASVILCPHCQRTATNGIKCQGICVADSSY